MWFFLKRHLEEYMSSSAYGLWALKSSNTVALWMTVSVHLNTNHKNILIARDNWVWQHSPWSFGKFLALHVYVSNSLAHPNNDFNCLYMLMSGPLEDVSEV